MKYIIEYFSSKAEDLYLYIHTILDLSKVNRHNGNNGFYRLKVLTIIKLLLHSWIRSDCMCQSFFSSNMYVNNTETLMFLKPEESTTDIFHLTA